MNLLDAVDDAGVSRERRCARSLILPLAPPAPSFSAVVRPEDIALRHRMQASGVAGEIASRTYLGDHASYTVRVGPLMLRVTTAEDGGC